MKVPRPFEQPIYVTRPLLPPVADFARIVEGIWERRWLTNKGPLHDALELALSEALHAKHLSLVANGTLALTLVCKAFELEGEVVTTPFTSPATIHALIWAGLTPVFADIDPVNLTLDPDRVEQALGARSSAIVGVHIYGMPCDVTRLGLLGERHGLHVLYDGAHAFGTETGGRPILEFGDATILSFHATKLFNTAEGGAAVVWDGEIKQRIDLLRTLGIADEATVKLPGINARMNELEAALGLANLPLVEGARTARSVLAGIYRTRLEEVEGITLFTVPPEVRDSHAYCVIRIGPGARMPRDTIYERLHTFNVFARRYFYPLCSNFPHLTHLESAKPANLPVANRAAGEVLCLPLYSDLGQDAAHRICDIIEYVMQA